MTARPSAAARHHAAAAAGTAAALVVGFSAACGTQVTAGGQQPLPILRLSGIPAASSPASGGVAGAGTPGRAQVELVGRLPSSGPRRGAVWQLRGGPAPAGSVRALASALHLTGTPRRSATGWRVSGHGILQVSDAPGQHWTYAGPPGPPGSAGPAGSSGPPGSEPCAGPLMPRAVTKARLTAPRRIQLTAWSCPQAAPRSRSPGGSGTRSPAGPGPRYPAGPGSGYPAAQGPGTPATAGPPPAPPAESAAAPVLRAAGVAGSPVRTTSAGSVTSVSADPAVRGLPTTGFSTVVGVGPGGAISTASGWLGRPVRGSVYPLDGAEQAVGTLRAAAAKAAPAPRGGNPPRAECPVEPSGPACASSSGPRAGPVPLIRVTGAAYGLVLAYASTSTGPAGSAASGSADGGASGPGGSGRPLLVPAWLVRVQGSGVPVPEVAVSPRYLASG